jgi:hypothetical protein
MISAFNDEDSTEHTSKKARLASPDIGNADQSADDESDNDLQLAGAASSSKQGRVISRGKQDSVTRQILVILPRLVLRLAVLGTDLCSALRDLQTSMTLICAVSTSTQVLSRKRRSLHLRQGLLLLSTRRCLARTWPARSWRLPLTTKALLSVLSRSRVLPRQPL